LVLFVNVWAIELLQLHTAIKRFNRKSSLFTRKKKIPQECSRQNTSLYYVFLPMKLTRQNI